jgi:uncharacterized membrane protein
LVEVDSIDSEDEHRRAANAYLIWPLALASFVSDGDGSSAWVRVHARQALALGVLGSLALFVLLGLPLLTVLAVPDISSEATIAVYAAGIVADAAFFIAMLAVAARCAIRAARGELFSIPVVTPVVDRWLRTDAERP